MSASDPKRTSADIARFPFLQVRQASASSVYVGDPTIDVFDPYQIRRNMRLDILIPFAHWRNKELSLSRLCRTDRSVSSTNFLTGP
jgi:hypothetical protein